MHFHSDKLLENTDSSGHTNDMISSESDITIFNLIKILYIVLEN